MKHQIFESSDTNVKKFVFEFDGYDGEPKAIAETVLYRYGEYRKRTVICCSVQSGCRVGCAFCGTGKFFVRNLSEYEIRKQIDTALSTIDCKTSEIEKFQIMFMSMGEPMHNFHQLALALPLMAEQYPNAQLLISTSAPEETYKHWSELIALSKKFPQIGIQFSVHESTDENRSKLIPTETCTLRQIASLGEMWAAFTGRKPFFNYCVHPCNSTMADAERLAKIFNPDVWEVTLSVICQKSESVKKSIERQLDLIEGFRKLMLEKGFSMRVFNPAGQDDIGGGCGQLWYFQKWLKENHAK